MYKRGKVQNNVYYLVLRYLKTFHNVTYFMYRIFKHNKCYNYVPIQAYLKSVFGFEFSSFFFLSMLVGITKNNSMKDFAFKFFFRDSVTNYQNEYVCVYIGIKNSFIGRVLLNVLRQVAKI